MQLLQKLQFGVFDIIEVLTQVIFMYQYHIFILVLKVSFVNKSISHINNDFNILLIPYLFYDIHTCMRTHIHIAHFLPVNNFSTTIIILSIS